MRRMAGKGRDMMLHISIQRWEQHTQWVLTTNIVWDEVWQNFRIEKINSFLWQVLFNAPATNRWRNRNKPHSDVANHSPRCHRNRLEDLEHCLWECPRGRKMWKWTIKLIPITAVCTTSIQLTTTQALIVEPLDDHVPRFWWRSVRAATIWHIWTARNQEAIPKKRAPFVGTKAKIWQQVHRDLINEWNRRVEQCAKGIIMEQQLVQNYKFDFGQNSAMYTIQGAKIHVACIPPEPD